MTHSDTFDVVLHSIIILVGPIFAMGIVNRTKAIWSGRKGPNLNQLYFDLTRLMRKTPVYSHVSSWIFQLAPWVALVTSLVAALICPIVPGFSVISFPLDFVYFAYLLGLGRVFVILAAMDTGSSFEGMGASREATFSAFIEPVLFFSMGTLSVVNGTGSFRELIQISHDGGLGWGVRFGLVFSLFILLQVEASRVPVDDPNTHLELTMIHEVMILDTSGPELAAMQYGSAVKFVVISGMIAALLNPVQTQNGGAIGWLVSIGIMLGIGITVGLAESLIARFRLRSVPAFALTGVFVSVVSLVASLVWSEGLRQ